MDVGRVHDAAEFLLVENFFGQALVAARDVDVCDGIVEDEILFGEPAEKGPEVGEDGVLIGETDGPVGAGVDGVKEKALEAFNDLARNFRGPEDAALLAPERELAEGIEGAEILIGNDYEIALIEERVGISHEELRVMVPIVITTLGNKGSIIETRKDSIHIKPAKPKSVSDPTGAGDAYRAGFLSGYLRAPRSRPGLERGALEIKDLVVCGQMGSVASVYTVEKYGTVTHTFTKKEFIKRYKENYGGMIKF